MMVHTVMGKRRRAEYLYDPRSGGESLRTERLRMERKPFEPTRTNYFSVYLIESVSGQFWADTSQFAFAPGELLFFVPYQHIRFVPDSAVEAELVEFHANFLCIETFHSEVGCSGILFNDPYGIPVVALDKRSRNEVKQLLDRVRHEDAERELAYSEVMLAQLKVLLILATRLKSSGSDACVSGADLRHPVLAELRELIEQHYHTLHSPAEYAKRLHVGRRV